MSACTNHLYKGEANYKFNDKDQKVIVYWSNTTNIFDSEGKPDIVTMLDACSDYRIQFSERNDGALIFLGSSSSFNRLNDMGEIINSTTFKC